MARLVFGMNQSLDGYVDHMAFGPSPTLFRHFIEEAQGQAGSVYGRQMYEVMRYWDEDHDLEDAIRVLKTDRDGEIEVAGPHLAQSLTELGLIDEYRIYLGLRSCLILAFDCGGRPFVHGDLPVFVCRLHLEVKGTRFLADVRDVATRAFAVHHDLDDAAADRASQE